MTAPTIAEIYSRPGYLGTLNRDWVANWATRGCHDRAGLPWASCYPALDGLSTLQDVLDAIRGDRDATTRRPGGPDAILHALLSLAAGTDADEAAARTVLQTMLGAVNHLADTAAARGASDAVNAAMAAMWEGIRTYPLHRTNAVAANLKLDALKRLPRPTVVEIADQDLVDQALAHVTGEDSRDTVDAAQVIAWARERDALTEDDAQVLALVYLEIDRLPMLEVATRLGISAAAARQRHHRAVRKLTQAVLESMSV